MDSHNTDESKKTPPLTEEIKELPACPNSYSEKLEMSNLPLEKHTVPLASSSKTICRPDAPQVKEWCLWQSLECNEDFLEHPPLLQYEEKFPENTKCMKCILCHLICPPPPYSCENDHLLCFSCTSVQKGSTCPIKWYSNTIYTKDGNNRCEKLLKPIDIANYQDEFPEPKTTYVCPFRKFGCSTANLPPEKVVEHAQTFCQFRYGVKCFICSSNDEKGSIRFGNLKKHILQYHGAFEFDLKQYLKKNAPIPFEYYYWNLPSVEEMRVPIMLVNTYKNKKYIYALTVKKTKEYLYFWLYESIEQGARKKDVQGKITIVSRTPNPWNNPNSEDLTASDAIHDSSVSSEDVIESGRLIKIKVGDFEEAYVGVQQPNPEQSVENQQQTPPHHFYVLKMDIWKKKKIAHQSTTASLSQRLQSLSVSNTQ